MDWDPTQFFRGSSDPPANPFALVVLNQPINEHAYAVLKEDASFTICADGGANRFYEMTASHGKESTDLPNAILGDLDSIRPSIRTHYERLGVPVIEDPDQFTTDFTKCLTYLQSHTREILENAHVPRPDSGTDADHSTDLDILILGGLGGRVDQAFSQIHHLYTVTQTQTQTQTQSEDQHQHQHGRSSQSQQQPSIGKLYLISEESITFILAQGKNTIHTPKTNQHPKQTSKQTSKDEPEHEHEVEHNDALLSENVGIIPISGPAEITIRGFEWDVEHWRTEMGGKMSTSNHIRAEKVEVDVETEGAVMLFTVELAGRFKRIR